MKSVVLVAIAGRQFFIGIGTVRGELDHYPYHLIPM